MQVIELKQVFLEYFFKNKEKKENRSNPNNESKLYNNTYDTLKEQKSNIKSIRNTKRKQ